MLWSWGLLQLLFVFSFGSCQQVQVIKLDQIGEVLEFVRNFESKFQELQNMLIEKITDTNEDLNKKLSENHQIQMEVISSTKEDLNKKLSENHQIQMEEITSTKEAIETRLGTMERDMSELNERVSLTQNITLLNQDLLKEGNVCTPQVQEASHMDLLYQTFADIFESEHEFKQAVLNQLEKLQFLLATDECSSSLDDCSPQADCQDSLVGFSCVCSSGYHGDGHTCEDVDECEDNNTCAENADCVNSDGSYECSCRGGFSGDGVTSCEDVNECQSSIHGCHANAECQNHVGNFSCVCREGFTGDGVTCESSFRCESPSVTMEQLGCVTLVTTERTWEESRTNCLSLGENLLEGITSQRQLEQLKGHFPTDAPWIGMRNLKWVTGGDSLDADSPLWGATEPDEGGQECADACLRCNPPSLYDISCSGTRSSLCQKH